ncbi:unnamed protein product, partial [marine sediment metagenome]
MIQVRRKQRSDAIMCGRSLAARGFGKLELTLLFALCAAIMVVAIPYARHSHIAANQRAALKALISVAAEQENWLQEAMVDQDDNTLGEYGLLGELAGRLVPRSGQEPADPAFIPPLLATAGKDG